MPLSQALETVHSCDAHLQIYVARHEGEEAYLRINKRSAAPSQMRTEGAEIVANVIALDWDRPKHAAWTSGQEVSEFCQRLAGVDLPNPSAFYTTRHGARFVYVLTESVPVAEVEPIIRGLVRDFWREGIEVDTQCQDWTRLFRLPRTLDSETGEQLWFDDDRFVLMQSGALLDPYTIEPGDERPEEVYGEVDFEFADRPTPEECREQLWVRSSGRDTMTQWQKTAKRYLRGRECFPYLFEHKEVDFAEGTRNSTLTEMIGSVVGLLFHRDDSSAEGVYALFEPVADQLDPDRDTPCWNAVAWSLVQRMWAAEEAKKRADDIAREEALADAEDVRQVVHEAFSEWAEDMPDDPIDAERFVSSRMLALAPRGIYVMQRNGEYCPWAVKDRALIAQVRHLGMEEVIQVQEMRNNVWQDKAPQTLISQYGVPVRRIESSPEIDRTHIKDSVLMLRAHQLRKDLEPSFSKEVDNWLQLIGGEMYAELVEYLSHCLDVRRGICALNLMGASGTGKGMLALAVSECFEYPHANDGRALGKFNAGLLENPVVHIDEGMPIAGDGRAIDEVLRSLVVGGNVAIEPKGLDVIHAFIYPRILITVNNESVLERICGQRDLNEQDIAALEQRILTIKVGPAAARFLTSRGNWAYTNGWVQRAPYLMSRHIMYLHATRKPSSHSSGRLLVEGKRHTSMMREMTLRTPAAQATIRTLLGMIEGGSRSPGFHSFEGQVHVAPHAVVKFYEQNLSDKMRRPLSSKMVGKVLKKICRYEAGAATTLEGPMGHRSAKQRWWHIDTEVLLYEAIASGHPHEKLRKLYREEHGEAALAMLEESYDREEVHEV